MPFPYLELPPELRNRIMRYALVPGIVCLRPSLPGGNNATINTRRQLWYRSRPVPNLQLLATCKQIYAEGLRMFYSNNIFCIPSGADLDIPSYFESLQPQHKAMITKIGIGIGIDDLTLEAFEGLETGNWADFSSHDGWGPAGLGLLVSSHAQHMMYRICEQKIHVVGQYPGFSPAVELSVILVDHDDQEVPCSSLLVPVRVNSIVRHTRYSIDGSPDTLVTTAGESVASKIRAMIDERGWQQFKVWFRDMLNDTEDLVGYAADH